MDKWRAMLFDALMQLPHLKSRRCLAAVLAILAAAAAAPAADLFVYFGTHSSGPGIGFSLAHFDTDTGALTPPQFLLEAVEPAYFVIAPDGRHLYTCNSGKAATVSAYATEPHTGRLTFLNRADTGGGDTSYLSLDQTGRYALAANYDGGSIAVFELQPDGSFGARTAFVQHTGKGVNPQRQSHAFAHSIITDPDNKFALAADLGLDKLFVYRFDARDGSLQTNDPPFVSVQPGAGARHVKFHPNGKWVYLITEMGSTIYAYNWDAARGALAEFQTISTLPADFHGSSACSELLVHPNGKFLYGSNRGHDSLAVFAVDPANGRLTPVQTISSGGKTPRCFAIDPTGRWIVCANHDSNNVVVFRIDETTGRLTQTGQPVSAPTPYCPRFLPVR
jgi:6-phosphogluconolactonase